MRLLNNLVFIKTSTTSRLREHYDELAGEAIAEIIDRLYINETLRHLDRNKLSGGCPHDGVHFAAFRTLLRLPAWRIFLARWALGTRSLDDRIEDILTDYGHTEAPLDEPTRKWFGGGDWWKP